MKQSEWVRKLKALADENRLLILRALLQKPATVSHLTDRLDLSQYNVSKHLRVLREAGLIEMEKEGRFRFYRVSERLKSHLAANKNVLDLGCCTFRFDRLQAV